MLLRQKRTAHSIPARVGMIQKMVVRGPAGFRPTLPAFLKLYRLDG